MTEISKGYNVDQIGSMANNKKSTHAEPTGKKNLFIIYRKLV